MLDRRILGLLELSPLGLTNGQLLWRLSANGTRYDASELVDALDRLSRTGSVRTEGARWRAVRTAAGTLPPVGGSDRRQSSGPGDVLRAAPAGVGPSPETVVPPDDLLDPASVADPAALLRYYAATQRRDPRGSVETFPDIHGVKWHLFEGSGRWWEGAEVTIPTAGVEAGFLQALAESGGRGAAAVGWPIAVFDNPMGKLCVPGLLLPASWQLQGDRMTFAVEAVEPSLNPAFVRQVRARTGLGEDVLLRALEADETGAGLEVVARRLSHLLARIGGRVLRLAELSPEMALAGDGLRNAAALFLPDESSFTRRVAEDLDRIADWTSARWSGTALAGLLGAGQGDAVQPPAADVAEIDALTERQFLAADAALSHPLTAIQGPPGTGKSQVIVALIASALAAGQSVLFAARNHRAIDEVEGRLSELLPGAKIVVRTRDADGERNTSVLDVLSELANGGAADPEAAAAGADRRRLLTEAARAVSAARRAEAERTRLRLELADLIERQEDLAAAYAEAGARPAERRGFLSWLRGLVRRRRPNLGAPLGADARPAEIRHRIDALRARLKELPEPTDPPLPEMRKHLPPLARAVETPDDGTLQHLRARKSDLDFQRGRAQPRDLSADDARLLLRHRPVWMASTLSVPARIPLIPGLFDLAIFDEASQCDIASALPILARAKRAVIVGDPDQLSFIPALGVAQEHALMDAVGLPKAGRGAWAQSRNSLFDFARNRLGAGGLHLLPDQFRSAPDIVDYISRAFYGGRLVARRSDEEFQPPGSYRPGLHWEDVRGPCGREDGGNVNHTEAEWIAARIAALAGEQSFEGSVGVISPFNAQVGLIRRLAGRAVPEAARQRLRLTIDTVDGWQGGEADAVFISLAVGPGAAPSAVTFLQKDRRRFNVAVSRARAVAVIVGDLAWARDCGIAHVQMLAERATQPPAAAPRGFDSKWERRVHEALVRRGHNPESQYRLGSRSLDFALFHGAVKLDLEVDGRKWHIGVGGERKVSDRLRDGELIAKGWKVRRFWVDELAADMEGCLDIVERDLGLRH